jgi:nitrate/TMAO reductase-like tetraheme cytochrome c subunit
MRIGLGVALCVTALSAVPARGAEIAGWESNQCVACHQVEQLPISLGHSMSEWQASSHARSGVGCEKCHGGNASIADPRTAHDGVLPSSDPKSTVSPHNLAATCGACHERQYDAYKDTVHAKQVEGDGDAATCLTCHGSMATSYPSPRELKSRCSVCHEKPVQAQSALSWLAAAKTHLFRARRAIDQAKSAAPDWYPGAVERFHSMEKDLAAIEIEWHKFDMKSSVKLSRDLLALGKLLEEEAHLKVKLNQEMGK